MTELTTSENAEPKEPLEHSTSSEAKKFPLWKKLLLGLALLLVVSGFALGYLLDVPREGTDAATQDAPPNYYQMPPTPQMSLQSGPPPGIQALTPGVTPESTTTSVFDGFKLPEQAADWSPLLINLGFSFFVGFAIGYALRAFFKVGLIVAGVFLLGLFGLQYAGLVDVNWSAMEGHYDSALGWLGQQASVFSGFISEHLSSSGMVALGLFTGFKKR